MTREVVVRRYQVRRGAVLSEAAAAQLRLQNEMWNRLVALDHEYRDRVHALTAAAPAVVAAESAVAALLDERSGLIAERKRLRKVARQKIATADIDARLGELKPLMAAARQALAECRRAAREERRGSAELVALRAELKSRKAARQAILDRRGDPDPPSREALAAARAAVHETATALAACCAAEPDTLPAIEAARRAAVTAVRQEFAGRGLHWGNYNAVIGSYDTARRQAMKSGTALKFHGFRGDGRLTNQIQGGITPADLLSGGKTKIGAPADPTPGITSRRRAPAMRRFSMRLDADHSIERSMLLSRDIPADATVMQAQVVRRRIAAHVRESVIFTATRPADVTAATGPAIAVDLGWRRLADGIRVATVVRDGGALTHIICPERVLGILAACDDLQRRRDELRAAILATLAAVEWRGGPLAEDFAGLRQTPPAAFGRIARLEFAWREHQDWQPETYAALKKWRRLDKKFWEAGANMRDHALAVRLDHYRREAARVVTDAGTLILEKFDIRQAARRETRAGEETSQVAAMRHYRQVTAPGLLRQWLVTQAQKRGIAIVWHEDESNGPHAACGTRHTVPDPTALRRYCPGCGAYYDVDENACRVMLAAYHASAPAAPEPRAALAG